MADDYVAPKRDQVNRKVLPGRPETCMVEYPLWNIPRPVSALIAKLQEFPPDADVYLESGCDYCCDTGSLMVNWCDDSTEAERETQAAKVAAAEAHAAEMAAFRAWKAEQDHGVASVGAGSLTSPADEFDEGWDESGCGCGLWICRECRPEEFAPGGRLYSGPIVPLVVPDTQETPTND